MPIALEFFLQYAYAILFLWVLLEMLGLPVPSIPVLLTAGSLTATSQLSLPAVLAVVVAACVLGDSAWYFMGRRYGNAVLKLLCRFSWEASTCVVKTERYFERRGATTLLFAKFVPGLSTVAPPIAGQTGMPFARFFLFDLGGSVIWALTYVLAGRFFLDLIKRNQMLLGVFGHFALALFVLAVLGLMFQRFWKQRMFLRSVRELRLDASELAHMMELAERQGNIPPFIVDLRHPLDYLPDPRVLPGAVRVSPSELTAHEALLPRDRDVVLYCTCPSEETSAKVALQLHKLGINRVRPLRGGFEGWRDGGFPLVDYVAPPVAEKLTDPVTAHAAA